MPGFAVHRWTAVIRTHPTPHTEELMKRILHTLAAGAFAIALPIAALAAETADAKPDVKPADKTAEKPAAKPAAKPAKKGDKAMPKDAASPVVVMKTSLGEIKIKLDKD